MNFRWSVVLFITSIIEASLQICLNLESASPLLQPFRSYRREVSRYVRCQNVTLSSNFHAKIDPLLRSKVQWVEINNTNSPEIATGAFKTLQTLPDLRINGANVRVIQAGAFNGLFNLTQLSLMNNTISDLNENCFSNLTKLERLDLSFNNILTIQENTFTRLNNLRYLILANNFISDLPSTLFQNLTNIEILDLSFNKLDTIDDKLLKNLSKLTDLYLNNNFLTTLNKNTLPAKGRLRILTIDKNHISILNNLSFSNSLPELHASSNLIQKLNFDAFCDINIIDLSDNGIITLNKISFKNIAVRQLYLDHNYLGLSGIENKTFSNLSSLEIISLSNNRLKQIKPDLFKNNDKLRQLNLARNCLIQIDFMNFPVSLQILNLTSNSFNSHLNLSRLINLQTLDISYNNLTEISFHFLEGLKSLMFLKLQHNKITTVTLGAFRDLTYLRTLDISNNNISTLEIGVFVGLNRLNSIDLSYNKLNVLNDDIFHNMKILQEIDISYNNLSLFNIEKALSHIYLLRNVGIGGNQWSCANLVNIVKHFRAIHIKGGSDHNVTNVNGIACIDEMQDSSKTALNLEKQSFNKVVEKLNINNILLIFILIILIVIVFLKYLPIIIQKHKRKLTKTKSMEELQLM